MKRALPLAPPSTVSGPAASLLAARSIRAPEEKAATCDACVMVTDDPGVTSFRADLKCCTFVPHLPNYGVGALLSATSDEEGKRRVLARIDAGDGVTPFGVGPTRAEDLLVRDLPAEQFGRSPALVCPYLDRTTARCTVWRHRNATCSTFFCKHDRGRAGADFWAAQKRVVAAVERALSCHCVQELGLAASAFVAATSRSNAWGGWVGRERDFFVACHTVVAALAPADVERLGGSELSLALEALAACGRVLDDTALPERLRAGTLGTVQYRRDRATVCTYSLNDGLSVPVELLSALHRFDGRPLAAVREELAEEDGLSIEDDLVRKLVDFGLLEPST